MNNQGRGSGLALIIILIVAVIIAWLFMTQMNRSVSEKKDKKQQEELVDQAQQAVDSLNQKIQETVQEP